MKKTFFILICLFTASRAFAALAPNYNAYKAYLKAVMSAKAGAYDAAVKEYEKVISLDPSAVSAYMELMYLNWQAGNKKRAFEIAEKIDLLDGKNPKTTNYMATFYLVANQPDKAKDFLNKTLELDPDNETATVYLAAYYYADNKLEKSAEYWNKFLKQQPDSATGYLQLGLVQEKLGMSEEALASYERVISIKPEAKEAYLSKARIYEATGRIKLAVAEYEKYIEVFPDNFYVLMYLGKCYFEDGRYDGAQEAFARSKKGLSGQDAQTASYWLGLVYAKMGNIAKAAQEFEPLFAKQPANASLAARLGYYYSLLRRYSKAEKKFRCAQQADPLNHEIFYLQGLNYTDWGKYDKAVKSFEKAVSLNPEFDDAYFFLGSAFDKKGDFESARKAFLRALEINPDHCAAMNYLGYSYADKNINLAEAEKLLERAVALEPRNGAFLDSLGWLYYRQEKYEQAKKYMILAANLSRDPLICEHLGDVYVELGKLNDAWIAYALSCDFAGEKSARRKLEMVRAKLSDKDFYNLSLLRAESNYKKLTSFKAGYKMKMNVRGYNVRAYIPFAYIKGEKVRIDIPGKFSPGGGAININDGNVSFEPEAVEERLPEEFGGLINFAAGIFSEDFFRQFKDRALMRKGKMITYSYGGYELVLNAETGLVEKIAKDGFSVQPAEYKAFFSAKIPYVVKAASKKLKLKGRFEAVSVSASGTGVKKENKEIYDKNIEKTLNDENQNFGAGEN